jgi:polyphosphate kinase 2 (PPK2 family)
MSTTTTSMATMNGKGRLAALDLSLKLSDDEYRERLAAAQSRLRYLVSQLPHKKRPLVATFEGWDAAGKGGAIRRLVEKVEPGLYVAHPIGAPVGDDKVHHYLWRFWRRLPEAGRMAIFDRTWYGRTLVERDEGFCDEAAWRRAFDEINEFEEQLVRAGTVLVKFFIHIGKDEQERRFNDRASDDFTSWKLTDEDWRNRDKWDAYVEAYEDTFERTSTATAPWTLVEGNDKGWARVKVCETVVNALEAAK